MEQKASESTVGHVQSVVCVECDDCDHSETFHLSVLPKFVQKMKAKLHARRYDHDVSITTRDVVYPCTGRSGGKQMSVSALDDEIETWFTHRFAKWRNVITGRQVVARKSDDVEGWNVIKRDADGNGDVCLTERPVRAIEAMFIASAWMEKGATPLWQDGEAMYPVTDAGTLLNAPDKRKRVPDEEKDMWLCLGDIESVAQFGVFIDPRDAEFAFEAATRAQRCEKSVKQITA